MTIDCPNCKERNDIEGEDLPARACDDKEFTCVECEHIFTISWYPVVEVREDGL